MILFAQVACTSQAQTQDLASIQDTKDVCTRSAASFAQGDVDGAIAVLAPHWPLPQAELDASAYQSKSQLDMVSKRFGSPIGSEFVRSTEAGKSFVRHTFAIKYEKHALRLTCLFYKPKDKWIVNAFNWDDKPMIGVDQ